MKRNLGFTLMELLIVIAILGVLAGLVWTALDPLDKINAANDSKVQSDMGVIGQAMEVYATGKAGLTGGNYYAISQAELVTNGDLKSQFTVPTGYAYSIVVPATCVAGGGVTCTSVAVCATPLKSKKFASATAGSQKVYLYSSTSGKACVYDNAANGCTVASTVACP